MSWSLPITLKDKLSGTWTKCLEILANSSFFSLSSGMVLGGRVSNRNVDTDTAFQSWDSVLSILGEEEAVEEDEELKLLPVFFSLPSVLQLRFISFLQSNISNVSSRSIHSFLQQLDNSNTNVWIKEAICQLRNTVAQYNAEAGQVPSLSSEKYAFTSESQNAFQEILSKLSNRQRWSWHQCSASPNLDRTKNETEGAAGTTWTSKNTENTTLKMSLSVMSSVKSTEALSPPECSEKTIDLIIIDEDSTDDATTVKKHSPVRKVHKKVKVYKPNFDILDDGECDKKRSDITLCGEGDKSGNGNGKILAGETSNVASNKGSSTEHTAVISDQPQLVNCEQLSVVTNNREFTVKNFKGKKRKFTEALTQTGDLGEFPVADDGESMSKIDEGEVIDPLAEVQRKTLTKCDNAADSEVKLTGIVMAYLDNIRETCSSKENTVVINKDIINCFLEMDASETSVACTYLSLACFSEKALVNFCDSIPWANLGTESTSVLLDSCFMSKLRNLECQASRTLLMSLASVSRIQSKALINMLANILQVTQSGEFQCQVLTSVCKDFLPSDCFGYLVRQLSKEGIIMNEHLVGVFQTLLDKSADLDTDSFSCFHSQLTNSCHEVSSSVKFGKLLMSVLTKYIKKMSSQQFITVCALVETHRSSFRKPLLAFIKRCK